MSQTIVNGLVLFSVTTLNHTLKRRPGVFNVLVHLLPIIPQLKTLSVSTSIVYNYPPMHSGVNIRGYILERETPRLASSTVHRP